MRVEKMAREFSFNGVKLPDPNPALTAEQVRDFYAATYPDITTASITGPEPVGSKMRFSFDRAIGSKG